MPKKTNITISKVFKGKSGEGKYGPWQIWDIYFEGSENKYTYFEKNDYIPIVGQVIDFLEWDVEKKGEYTNFTIKNIIPSDSKKSSQSHSEANDGTISCKANIGPITMWGKYISDIMCAIIKDGHTGKELDERTKDAVETLSDSSLMIMGILKNAQCPKKQEETQPKPQETFSDGTPLPEEIPF